MIQRTMPIYLSIPAILLALAWVVGTWGGRKALRFYLSFVLALGLVFGAWFGYIFLFLYSPH
jgi:hypothetical protein